MKKYDQIHETVLKDIFDVYEDIKDLTDGELGDLINKHRGVRTSTSIARASNDLICVFPVLSSRNIAINNQAMVSKAIEKNCVAMLQMLFSANQLSDADSAQDYIKAFHTNINKSAKLLDLDDVMKISDAIGINDSAIQVGGKVDYAIVEQVRRDMRNLNFYFENSISEKSLEESFRCNLDPNGDFIVEVQTKPYRESAEPDYDQFIPEDPEVSRLKGVISKLGGELDSFKRMSAVQMDNLKKSHDAYKRSIDHERDLTSIAKNIADIEKSERDMKKSDIEFLSKQVLNTEYKKANELMPTMMVINFKSKIGDSYEIVDSVIIGVKAKLYPISSEDIITHLVAKAKDANWFQKLLKVSTREISFFKDFLFAIDKAKIDALSLSRKGSTNKMWKVLERRATKSRWNRLMAKNNDASAITTIMISQNEVDFIKKEYQIDITDIYNTRTLLDKFNLLGLCIVDESLEIAKFMFDTGEETWETIAFNNLEREANDNTYKKIVNLMTRTM